MSNETKRGVFGQLLNAYQNLIVKDIEMPDGNYRENITTPWNIVYDAAFPDDMPVIPKAVGAFIKRQKAAEDNLATLFYDACGFDKERDNGWSMFQDTDKFLWAYDNQNTFARAWVLGLWRVEETGEIVKLEVEK